MWASHLRTKAYAVASLEQMTTPGRLANGQPVTYGLGLALLPSSAGRYFAHSGGEDLFSTAVHLAYVPKLKTSVVSLANTGNSDIMHVNGAAWSALRRTT